MKELDKLPDLKNEKVLSDFNDNNEISAYAQEAMIYFVKAGIVQGSSGGLTPKANSMRSEAAQMIYNLIK